jgi:hypothetical protein
MRPRRPGHRLPAPLLGTACLAALFGCARVQVVMGLRTPLEKVPVVALHPALAEGPGMAPGSKGHLVVTVDSVDGTVLTTEGAGKGKVRWQDLELEAAVVSIERPGVLALPADPRTSEGRQARVSATVPSHPGLRADLAIPLRYDWPFEARPYLGAVHCGAGGPVPVFIEGTVPPLW